MSEDQLKAFLDEVKASKDLQDKLIAAHDNDAVMAIAREAGFSVSFAAMDNAVAELSDQDLETVAGGLTPAPLFVVTIFGVTAVAGAGGVIALTVSSNDCGSGGGKGPIAPAVS